ncbi:Highly reducing polyketide synthase ZEA2 [Colletotrichum orbiculare MAFF 240422]|uniref:Highly reducing polyketide synthase ZEA2 n=1 Tax=Colletotrichum orbiculare (strain 104-T / ATCC 96160 / CBS 514.97 / LARS 414 / MAFF 240422) TaxID=1213857 RepID=N4V7U8_COLOR|nr:Highly reducing polyketide synthase ZEA2 [Colletotrichum orbiculare MAFF 240422]
MSTPDDAVAIIGVACRFPGDASSPEKFWDLLVSKRDTYGLPPNRWNPDAFHHPGTDKLHTMANKGAHFLTDDVMAFDAAFFNISQAEATALDPQQRLTLEVTYEALESAGLPMESVAGSRTGCFMGSSAADYRDTINRDPDSNPRYSLLGVVTEMISNRTSWFYDLRGPSMTVQTACSSSLVAVHLACRSILAGESGMAVAGGVNLMLNPDYSLYLNNMTMSTREGHCKSFDASGDGYARGEGCGVIVLKKLSEALRDGDPVRAVIRGSGVNADGFTQGFTMPSAAAQAALIRDVYAAAGLDMSETQYVEAHGTGTKVGDPVEARAIYETLGRSARPGKKVILGSVKPNIGHLECAAGVAAIIKGVLALEKSTIPPNLYFKTPNPAIPFDDWNLRVPTKLTPWPAAGSESEARRMSISSFGVGGTNAHAILEKAPGPTAPRRPAPAIGSFGGLGALLGRSVASSTSSSSTSRTAAYRKRLFVLSSHDNAGVARVGEVLASHIGQVETHAGPEYAADLAYTLGAKRSRLAWKTYCIASGLSDLRTHLAELRTGAGPVRSSSGSPKVGFVFTGQAAQWARMGVELLGNDVFRASVDECDRHLSELGCSWQTAAELKKADGSSRVDEAEVSQTVCTVLQMALVDLLESWGVRPARVVGHSSGEIAAAYCIGALSRRDAVSVAHLRGVASASLKRVAPEHDGGMMAVGCSPDEAECLIGDLGASDLVVACVNSPCNVTISGSVSHLTKLQAVLEGEDIFNRRLAVDVAYHSDHIQSVYPSYVQSMGQIHARRGKAEAPVMFSSVDRGEVAPESMGAFYWGRNLINPVQFSDALADLISAPSAEHSHESSSSPSSPQVDLLVEIGPHGALGGPIKEILERTGFKGVEYRSALTKGQNATDTTLSLAGWLFSRGAPVDIAKVNRDESPETLTDLPAYPWNHSRRFDASSRINKEFSMRSHAQKSLLGAPFTSVSERERIWRSHLRLSEEGWIRDHKIVSVVLFPGAGLVVMAIEAARQMADPGKVVRAFRLRDISIGSAVVVNEDKATEAIIHLRPHLSGTSASSSSSPWLEFTVSTSGGADMPVRENCHGLIQIDYKTANDEHMDRELSASTKSSIENYNQARNTCSHDLSIDKFYKDLADVGLGFGHTFRNITSLRLGPGQSVFELTVGDPGETFSTGQPGRHHLVHPTTLDSLFSPTFAALYDGANPLTRPFIPTFIEELVVSRAMPDAVGSRLRGFARAARRGFGEISADVDVFDDSVSASLMTMRGYRCTSEISEDARGNNQHAEMAARLCSQVRWEHALELLEPDQVDRVVREAGPGQVERMGKMLRMLRHSNPASRVLEVLPEAKTTSLAISCSIAASSGLLSLERVSFASLGPSTDKGANNLLLFDAAGLSRTSSGSAEQFDIILVPDGCSVDSEGVTTHLKPLLSPSGQVVTGMKLDGALAVDLRLQDASVTVYSRHGKTTSQPDNSSRADLLIIEPRVSPDWTQELVELLQTRGFQTQTIPWGPELLQNCPGKYCICLAELDTSLLEDLSAQDFTLVKDVVLKASGLLWVTGFDGPAASIVSGLLRSVRRETASDSLRTLQFGQDLPVGTAAVRAMARIVQSHTRETEFLVDDDGLVKTSRIFLDRLMNETIESLVGDQVRTQAVRDIDFPVKLAIGKPGLLDTLYFEPHTGLSAPLEDDEVEIRVAATGVNFRDVMISMGIIPTPELGYEASGVVTAVGSNVNNVRKGARVCAHVVGAHATVVRTPAFMCAPLPDAVSLQDGAAMPVVLTTAYHALVNLARLGPGQSVLVHAAAGGVGQAAVQLARHLGATVYATVSSPEKRNLVTSRYGVPDEHVFYSRDASFAMAVRRVTGGRGVDCVLNSLAGELLRESFYCLAPLGIMVEIGSRDVLDNTRLDMRPFSKSTTFACFTLLDLVRDAPEVMEQATQQAFELVRKGVLEPPYPVKTLPVSRVQDALRLMQSGKHVGKLVLSFDGDAVIPVKRGPQSINLNLNPDVTYLLVGGLGGLGRSLAKLLVTSGARNIAFLSRSGASSPASRATVDELQGLGASVRAYRADIADICSMRSALACCLNDLPPVRGVFHMAMLLRDSPFETMTHAQWVESTRPKIQGTENLHAYFGESQDLDFFVTLASISGVVGNKAQANYAAGSAFQDAVARGRASRGLAGVSVDLGIMLDVGVVAERGSAGDLRSWQDVLGVREPLFHALMKAVVDTQRTAGRPPAQICVGLGTAEAFEAARARKPDYLSHDLRFAPLNAVSLAAAGGASSAGSDSSSETASLKSRIAASQTRVQAVQVITEGLVAKIADILQIASLEVDTGRPVYLYGVDSLVAMEVRNWVRREMDAQIQIFDVLEAVPMTRLADKIAERSRLVGESYSCPA